MSVVHPLFIVDATRDEPVINGHAETLMDGETSSRFSEAREDDDSDDENTSFPGEIYSERDALLKSLSALIRVLRVIGLYFRQEDGYRKTRQIGNARLSALSSSDSTRDGPESMNMRENGGQKKRMWYGTKVYSVIVLVFLWICMARFFLVFRSNDRFNSMLINKLTTLARMLMAAIMHTSCVVACWSGRLDRVLCELRVTDEFNTRMQKRSTINCAIGVIIIISSIAFTIASISSGSSHFDFYLVPFTTYIPVAGTSFYVIKAAFVCASFWTVASWIMPQALNHTLTTILVLLYYDLDAKFVKAIDDNGRFNGNIRTFRRRHQAICRGVKEADQFVMIGNVAGFICHIFTVILYLSRS